MFRSRYSQGTESCAQFHQSTVLLILSLTPYISKTSKLTLRLSCTEQFEVMQKLKNFLIENFDTDAEGWIPPDAWEISKEIHKNAFQTWMDEAREGSEPQLTGNCGKALAV